MNAAPVPRPPSPKSLGNDAVPTTRNGATREPPVGAWNLAWTSTHVGTHLMERGISERDLADPGGGVAVDGRNEERATDSFAYDR